MTGMGVALAVVAFVRFVGHLRSADLCALPEEYVASFGTRRSALPAGGPP